MRVQFSSLNSSRTPLSFATTYSCSLDPAVAGSQFPPDFPPSCNLNVTFARLRTDASLNSSRTSLSLTTIWRDMLNYVLDQPQFPSDSLPLATSPILITKYLQCDTSIPLGLPTPLQLIQPVDWSVGNHGVSIPLGLPSLLQHCTN